MPTTTIYSSPGDGYLYSRSSSSWSTARSAESAGFVNSPDGLTTDTDKMLVGLSYGSGDNRYGFMRGYLYFDTSAIPTNAVISSANVKVYVTGALTIWSPGFNLMLHAGVSSADPVDPLAVEAFNKTKYKYGGASDASIFNALSGQVTFTFNTEGKYSWINLGGTSKFVIISSLDVSPTVPQSGMKVYLYTQEKLSSYRPQLYVAYETKPTVTTGEATDIDLTTAVGHGTITDYGSLGSGSITSYGVIWNDDGTDPVDLASADNYAEGSDLNIGTGEFTADMAFLQPDGAYYYRAYVTSTTPATSYGSAIDFNMPGNPPTLTVTISAATNITKSAARVNGNITDDGGNSVTQHGFVYESGSDPGTPANHTSAPHYTEKGAGAEGTYYSDISSLSNDTVYFVRAYAVTAEEGHAYSDVLTFRTLKEVTVDIDDLPDAGGYLKQLSTYDRTEDTTCASECKEVASAYSHTHSLYDITILRTYDTSPPYSDKCEIRRSCVYFDTSSIPSGATITSAKLYVYVTARYKTGTASQKCGIGVWHSASYPSTSMANSDYDESLYTLIAQMPHGYYGDGAYWPITIDPSYVDQSETYMKTRFMLRVYDDVGYGECGQEDETYYQSADIGNIYLNVVYTTTPSLAFPNINIGDAWKASTDVNINIGDAWKSVVDINENVGDVWKSITS